MLKTKDGEQRLVEIRAVESQDEKMTIEGYAIVFDIPATHKYGERSFTETIAKGALSNTDMKDVPLRYNHNDNVMIMARTRNKSLRLIVDEKGLLIQADLIDTQSNRDLFKSVQEGLIDKMSFAFRVADGGDKWSFGENETIRNVTSIERLFDVSIVDEPFYSDTSIYARSLELLDSEKRQLDSMSEIETLKQKIILKGKI